jgi:cellulose synthase/poly-beta-1,6-N-acetylglucosamine synthase-like glycosyltransferase
MRKYGVRNIVVTVTTDWDIAQAVNRYCRSRLLFNAAEELAATAPGKSAKAGLALWQKILSGVLVVLLVAGMIWATATTTIVLLVLANIFFLVAVLFRTFAAVVGAIQRHDDRVVAAARARVALSSPPPERIPDADLPTYTILVPVYHEANVISNVIHYVGELDWPHSKLQVLILMEEGDDETMQACKAAAPPEYVQLLVVPRGIPMTKPRACNFGLMFAHGDYLVIFDAEDRPERDQLRKAHEAFQRASVIEGPAHAASNRPLVCVQAALNYFNSRQNVLTRMFTLEYSTWFDGMLRGMEVFRFPIPLGGTSNHFRTSLLRQLGGWDPYNVTEDADLGMRAATAGYRISTIDSTTWEEACSEIPSWIRQRTRWIKGYMVTALVDARYPVKFARSAGFRSIFTTFALIASTPLLFLSYPVVWGFTILTYVGIKFTVLDLPPVFAQAAVWNALVGNLVVIALAAWAGWRRQGWRLAGYAVFNPVYWFLHAWAAWRALFLLVVKPFHWEKTPHGLDSAPREVGTVV